MKRARGGSRKSRPRPSASGGGGDRVEDDPDLGRLAAELQAVVDATEPRGLTAEQKALVDRFGNAFAARHRLGQLARMIGATPTQVRGYRWNGQFRT